MNNRLISCNRDWTTLTITDKSGKPTYLSYNDIEFVKFGYITKSKFFFKKTTEKIEILQKGSKKSIVLTKLMDWEHFDQYKQEVTKFAKDNNIRIDMNFY